MIDTHASQLTFENTGYVLKTDTTTINSNAYTVTPTATGFTVQLNAGFQTLLSGKNNLTFTYKMDLNGTSVLEQGYENAATVTTNLETASTTSESVMTYGKRFVKVDADNNNVPLAGTTFIVRSSDSDT
ncbi:cell surface protein, partial [Lactiplantibacillus plantarum]